MADCQHKRIEGLKVVFDCYSNKSINDLYNAHSYGIYEYLHAMKYGKRFKAEEYSNGIPAEQFENVIMEYFPVTVKQIREWAVFNI